MKPSRPNGPAAPVAPAARAFAALFGLFLGVALLKFGNPPIMERFVATPANMYDLVLGYPWPIQWAYIALAGLAVLGFAQARPNGGPPAWLLALPLAWLAWQCLAATQTLSAQLTWPTLEHFFACVICFYLGVFTLSRVANLGAFWTGLVGGFGLVLVVGWQQHFGGLEQTRRYFYLYLYPQMPEVPPEYLKKLASNRIFGTLFYPNALAGAVLLLLPASIRVLLRPNRWLTQGARSFLALVVFIGGCGCLYWSGSKGGWLLLLLLGLLTLLRAPVRKPLKLLVCAVVLAAGLAGFIWKYAGFFERGATSVSARFDYWRAGAQIAATHPLFGTGPGTFAIPYAQLKRPDAEMARLVHNDYLEQASDSGLPGFLLYVGFIVAALVIAFPGFSPRVQANAKTGPLWVCEGAFLIWLGLLGWCLQGLFEFGLYIPALAWPAFTLLGMLAGWRRPAKGVPP